MGVCLANDRGGFQFRFDEANVKAPLVSITSMLELRTVLRWIEGTIYSRPTLVLTTDPEMIKNIGKAVNQAQRARKISGMSNVGGAAGIAGAAISLNPFVIGGAIATYLAARSKAKADIDAVIALPEGKVGMGLNRRGYVIEDNEVRRLVLKWAYAAVDLDLSEDRTKSLTRLELDEMEAWLAAHPAV
jgi:hypothetical protein